jgi:hypothetical protein
LDGQAHPDGRRPWAHPTTGHARPTTITANFTATNFPSLTSRITARSSHSHPRHPKHRPLLSNNSTTKQDIGFTGYRQCEHFAPGSVESHYLCLHATTSNTVSGYDTINCHTSGTTGSGSLVTGLLCTQARRSARTYD